MYIYMYYVCKYYIYTLYLNYKYTVHEIYTTNVQYMYCIETRTTFFCVFTRFGRGSCYACSAGAASRVVLRASWADAAYRAFMP